MADYSKNYYGHEWRDDTPPDLSAANMLDIDGFIKELDSRTKDLKSTKLDSDSRIAERAEEAAREAEDAAERAMSGTPEGYATIVKKVGTLSNRNLLINSWFTINQRGASSYNGNEYTVDRWRKISGAGTIEPTSDGVRITGTGTSNVWLRQYIEFDPSYLGKTITTSVIVNGELVTVTGIIPSEVPTADKTINVKNAFDDWGGFNIVMQSSGNLYVQIGVGAGKTSIYRAVKLEIGNVSTLALDVAPDTAEELLKCQRYFFRLANKNGSNKDYIGIGFARDASYIMYDAILPVTMRGGTVGISTSANALSYSRTNANAAINAAGVSGYYVSTNRRSMMVQGSGLTAGLPYSIYLAPNGYIDFNAEL